MPQSRKPTGHFAKILIAGVALIAAGGGLYIYTVTLPSSGVAMDGIAIGLLSLLGLVLSGIGVVVAFLSAILWVRAKLRSMRS